VAAALMTIGCNNGGNSPMGLLSGLVMKQAQLLGHASFE
jgi:hypothetical protein